MSQRLSVWKVEFSSTYRIPLYRSSIVVYARGGVICAKGLHFSTFHWVSYNNYYTLVMDLLYIFIHYFTIKCCMRNVTQPHRIIRAEYKTHPLSVQFDITIQWESTLKTITIRNLYIKVMFDTIMHHDLGGVMITRNNEGLVRGTVKGKYISAKKKEYDEPCIVHINREWVNEDYTTSHPNLKFHHPNPKSSQPTTPALNAKFQ